MLKLNSEKLINAPSQGHKHDGVEASFQRTNPKHSLFDLTRFLIGTSSDQ